MFLAEVLQYRGVVHFSEVSKIAFGPGLRHPGNPLVRSEIYVMDEDGNNQRRLTNNPVFDRTPAWFSTANTISLE